jgi:hypothetical protein
MDLGSPHQFHNSLDRMSYLLTAGSLVILTLFAARIHLDGSHRYLITCELLDRLGFALHKALRVIGRFLTLVGPDTLI